MSFNINVKGGTHAGWRRPKPKPKPWHCMCTDKEEPNPGYRTRCDECGTKAP